MSKREVESLVSTTLTIVSMIVSLVVGIILAVFMIKESLPKAGLIIHGFVFIESIIGIFHMAIDFFNSFKSISLNSLFHSDFFEIGWLLILWFFFSGYLIINLIKKQDFAEKMKYTIGLSSGMVVASILEIIMVSIIGAAFSWDGLSVGLSILFVFIFGSICSFILGAARFFVDKFKNSSIFPKKRNKTFQSLTGASKRTQPLFLFTALKKRKFGFFDFFAFFP